MSNNLNLSTSGALEIFTLQNRLRSMSGVMYLMDEVSLDGPGPFTKLELLRKIYMETYVPICICGVRDYIISCMTAVTMTNTACRNDTLNPVRKPLRKHGALLWKQQRFFTSRCGQF